MSDAAFITDDVLFPAMFGLVVSLSLLGIIWICTRAARRKEQR